MREKTSECPTHVEYGRGTTEMCSRDPPALHSALAKVNGKNSSSQAESRIDGGLLPTPGGRLKFFKDGKFILELSHRRDGERTTWFPVPKKTFWPPASTTPNRQESSTSLSVSDDNSSIQSSPWQRDHCWKQTHPRRCVTTKFNFYYRRDPRSRLCTPPLQLARKRRRPLDPIHLPLIPDIGPNHWKTFNKLISNNQPITGKALTLIIDKLSRLDPNVVSPRKRILRELERVTLEDQASKRRATPQPQVTVSSTVTMTTSTSVPSHRQLSSYSITSILGEDKPSPEPGFLRSLLKLDDGHVKYSSSHSFPRTRVDPSVASANSSIHHPVYGLPSLPPGSFRAPGFWMHYPPVHFPPSIPIYPTPPPPPPHPPSSPIIHYKNYKEQSIIPPSDVPLNLSKHAG